MRISETKLVQLVESDPPVVVILDQTTGAEVVFDPAEFFRLKVAVDYFDAHLKAVVPNSGVAITPWKSV